MIRKKIKKKPINHKNKKIIKTQNGSESSWNFHKKLIKFKTIFKTLLLKLKMVTTKAKVILKFQIKKLKNSKKISPSFQMIMKSKINLKIKDQIIKFLYNLQLLKI